MLFSNPEARSLLANRHRRTPCVLLVDTSGSMEGEKIRRLNAGFRAFREDILRNQMAAQSVELCVISFGPVKVQSEFALLKEMPQLRFEADGVTPLKEALELAMLKVTERQQSYRDHGISYYRPWIFLLTDGDPTDAEGYFNDSYKKLLAPLQLAAQEKKFILFTIGIFGIFLNRKNVIVILMSVELILLAVNINLVAFSSFLGDLVGQVFAMLVLTVAAGEAAIGLAILVTYFRNRGSIAVEDINLMKG